MKMYFKYQFNWYLVLVKPGSILKLIVPKFTRKQNYTVGSKDKIML